jgi:hypothetical protein
VPHHAHVHVDSLINQTDNPRLIILYLVNARLHLLVHVTAVGNNSEVLEY